MPELDVAALGQAAIAIFRGGQSPTHVAAAYTMDELVNAFIGLRRAMIRLLNGLSGEQINFNPDEETYSLSEVVTHMIAAQGNTYNSFLESVSSPKPHIDPVPRSPGGGAEKGLSAETVQQRLQQATDALIQIVHETYDPNNTHQVQMGNFGLMSQKGFMLFQLMHDLDHFKQSQALRRSPSFPGRAKQMPD